MSTLSFMGEEFRFLDFEREKASPHGMCVSYRTKFGRLDITRIENDHALGWIAAMPSRVKDRVGIGATAQDAAWGLERLLNQIAASNRAKKLIESMKTDAQPEDL